MNIYIYIYIKLVEGLGRRGGQLLPLAKPETTHLSNCPNNFVLIFSHSQSRVQFFKNHIYIYIHLLDVYNKAKYCLNWFLLIDKH